MKNQNCINMKNYYIFSIVFTLVFSCNFISCSGTPDFIDKPVGNKIDLKMANNSEYPDLEFLFVFEDTLYTLYNSSKVFPIPIKSVSQITVNGYSDRNWIMPVLGLQVIPSIAIGIASNTVKGSGVGFILTGLLLIPAAIEVILFETSTPEAPEYKDLTEKNISKIKKYARYPIDLSREQINSIESYYGIFSGKTIFIKK
jgi:hypothetical protein